MKGRFFMQSQKQVTNQLEALEETVNLFYNYNRTDWRKDPNRQSEAYFETLQKVIDILDKDNILCLGTCADCGAYFMEGDPAYRIGDSGRYICDSCKEERFPQDRDWYIYMLEDEYWNYKTNSVWTHDELEKLSNQQLGEMAEDYSNDVDCTCFFTIA